MTIFLIPSAITITIRKLFKVFNGRVGQGIFRNKPNKEGNKYQLSTMLFPVPINQLKNCRSSQKITLTLSLNIKRFVNLSDIPKNPMANSVKHPTLMSDNNSFQFQKQDSKINCIPSPNCRHDLIHTRRPRKKVCL